MNRRCKDVLEKLNNPPILILVLVYIVTIISCVGSVLLITVNWHTGLLEIFTYILFGVAAITLFYSCFTLAKAIPRIKKSLINVLEKRKFTRNVLRNYDFRTVVFAIGSFSLSVVYSASHIAMSVMEKSIWYGMLAFYYISLACMRGGVLLYQKNKKHKNDLEKKIDAAKTFRTLGIVLIGVTVAMTVAVAQMVLINRHFEYAGLMIFVIATYTFYKLTMSIINIIKVRKHEDLTVKAIRNINLVDAAVSLVALQTAMFSAFGSEDPGMLVAVMNGLTGLCMCAFIFGLGIYMIKKANKIIRIYNNTFTENCTENNNG